MSKYIATYTPETELPTRYTELTYKNRPLEMYIENGVRFLG